MPNYYKNSRGDEVKDIIERVSIYLPNIFCFYEGNLIKYSCRWPYKGKSNDLEKIITYADYVNDLICKENLGPRFEFANTSYSRWDNDYNTACKISAIFINDYKHCVSHNHKLGGLYQCILNESLSWWTIPCDEARSVLFNLKNDCLEAIECLESTEENI